jgi:putative heme transporter
MRSRRRAVLRSALGVALIAAVFAEVLPRIASYGSVAHRLATVSAPWALALAAAAAVDVLTAALPWLAVLPQLSFVGALSFTQASTAVTTVLPGGAPLGMAISFGFLRRLHVGRGQAAFAVALTGLWSQVSILVYPLLGALLVFATGQLSGSTAAIAGASGAAAAVFVGLAVAAVRSQVGTLRLGDAAARAAARVARLLRRPPPAWSGETLVRLRKEWLGVLRRRWPSLTAATLANQLSAYVLFEVCLRAVGISVATLPPSEAFLAWAIGRVISSLPLTPGGIGVVELGLIGSLVGFGAPHAHVVAAVLLYRALVIVPTLVVGLLALLGLRPRAAEEPTP